MTSVGAAGNSKLVSSPWQSKTIEGSSKGVLSGRWDLSNHLSVAYSVPFVVDLSSQASGEASDQHRGRALGSLSVLSSAIRSAHWYRAQRPPFAPQNPALQGPLFLLTTSHQRRLTILLARHRRRLSLRRRGRTPLPPSRGGRKRQTGGGGRCSSFGRGRSRRSSVARAGGAAAEPGGVRERRGTIESAEMKRGKKRRGAWRRGRERGKISKSVPETTEPKRADGPSPSLEGEGGEENVMEGVKEQRRTNWESVVSQRREEHSSAPVQPVESESESERRSANSPIHAAHRP